MFDKVKVVALVAGLGFILTGFAAEPGRRELTGHVPPVVAHLAPAGRLSTNLLSLAIGLPLRNEPALDELLQQLYDPASTNFHKFLTPPEFAARFGPTEQDYRVVKQFASDNGLAVSGTFSNRLVVDVRGPAAAIARAFGVSLRIYHHPTEARDFYAPDREPSVPTNVPINDIMGLTDYAPPRPMAHPAVRPRGGTLNYNGSGPSGSYQGSDYRQAYIPGSPLTGSGQTVALFELDGYYAPDITNYEAICGYTNVPLLNVYLDGVTSNSTPGFSGVSGAVAEVSGDIEMAIAMAPGLAQVMVYEGNNPYDVFDQIATDDLARQVSSSWYFTYGHSYRWNGSLGSGTLDSILKQMVSQGQSMFQASGDADAYTGAAAFSSYYGPIPNDSPYVVSVGGTSLTLNGTAGSWSAETVWNYAPYGGSDANVGSGGGISGNYSIPSWQTNVSMALNNGSTTHRNIPDVALTADWIFIAYGSGSSGIYLGTSFAAPLWAGFCALANQMSLASSGTNLGFVNPALYHLANSSCYPRSFHDITTGNNIGANTAGLYYAEPGYDLCTGLGTPAGTNLINALVWPPPTFTSQPVGRTVTNGATVILTAAASSTTARSYYWLCNGANLSDGGNLSGSATNMLTITPATTNNTGNYQLVASNYTGSVTSLVAVVNVGYVPTVSVAPAALTLLAGSNAVFTATAGGTAPLGYLWKMNGTNFAGAGITGTNTSVLTLTGVTTNSAANYTVVVTNLFGSATSGVAALTVVLPPGIKSSSLTNYTLQCGSNNVTMAVSATGTAPLSYQWSFDGTAVAGATNTSFSVTNLHLSTHNVSIQITNLYAGLTSNAVLTVQDTLPPVITLNGSNHLMLELGSPFADPGASATDLCAGAVSVTVSGTVNTNAAGTNTLLYLATDGDGNTNTATRSVIIRDTTPPVITWSFTNLSLAAGSNCVAIMPDVTGTNYILATDLSGIGVIAENPTNGSLLPAGTNLVVLAVSDIYSNTAYSTNVIVVRDQTPPVLTLNGANPMFAELGQLFNDPGATAYDNCAGVVPVSATGTVNVSVLGTNTILYTADDGNGNTNTATRTVVVRDTTPPAILWSFTNLVLAAGSNCVAIMPDVTGTNDLLATDLSGVGMILESPTNGAALPLGSNLVVLAVSDIFSNTAYSTNVIVVRDETPPMILVQPQSQTNTAGTTASFSVAATACTPLGFQWFFDAAALPAQTNSTLTLSNVSLATAGDYAVVAAADGGAVTSLVASLTIYAPPVISGVSVVSSGGVLLSLGGTPGNTYILEGATNLLPPVNWVSLATNTLDGSGAWQFTDAQSTNFPQQFYRLMLAP